MRKLIHSKFELDLSNFRISDTEENNWFSDVFFTKYSFPFEIDLTDDLDIALDFISLYNSIDVQTYFEVKYVHNNKIEDAIFEIEEIAEKLSCTLRFGFEQLPSFDKKLSELSLDKFDLSSSQTIYEHAETIITQTWPAVNYNFPQVHIDKIDTDSDVWAWFDKIINNRVLGAFLTNQIDGPNQYTYNRNIMQPLPYFLHILQRGMIDAGYVLSGDILSDEIIKRATLYGDVNYYLENKLNEYVFSTGTDDYVSYTNYEVNKYRAIYYKSEIIKGIGSYRITGAVLAHSLPTENAFVRIKLNGNIIYEKIKPVNETDNNGNTMFNPNFTFTTLTDTNVLEFEALGNYEVSNPNFVVYTIYVNPMFYYNNNNDPFVCIINENKVDLTKSVPDISFGDFVKVIKNWFNYDLTVEGNQAIMNIIENEINYDNAVSLGEYEVKLVPRKVSQGTSFLLKFQDVDSKDYKFLPVFQNKDNVLNANYATNEKTIPIEIPALPLPLLNRKGVKTAHAFESNNSKAYLVVYDGIYNGNNLAKPNDDYLLPSVHLQYWKKWFAFRINSQGFTWTFKAWEEGINFLRAKSKVYAYKKFHIIKSINKTEIKPKLFEVQIETESLK